MKKDVHTIYVLLFVLGAIVSFVNFIPQAQAFYADSVSITVTSTASVASGTNINFPMLVSSTESFWAASSSGGMVQNLCTDAHGNPEACDLVFATSSGLCGVSNLNFETEQYSSTTGALVDWVNVPSVSTGTVIYSCYDNQAVVTDQSHPSSTWNSNYVAVYHFGEATSSLNLYDSTALNHTLTATATGGAPSSTPTSTATIDGGAFTNASSGLYNSSPIYTPTSSQTMTMQVWVRATTTTIPNGGTAAAALDFGNNGGAFGDVSIGQRNAARTQYGLNGSVTPILSYNMTTKMSSFALEITTSSIASATMMFYINGVSTSTATTTHVWANPTGELTIMAAGNSGPSPAFPGLAGVYDEVRVSNIVLSPSWLLTEYNNEESPSTFYTIGSPTPITPPVNPILSLWNAIVYNISII